MNRLAFLFLSPLLFLTACNEGGAVATTPGPQGESSAEAPSVDLEALLAEQKLDEVVAYLQPLFDAGTLSTEDSDLLARVRIHQNELPKAIKVLKTTLERSPAATAVAVRLSNVYVGLGQQKMALDTLLASREAGGADAELALLIGVGMARLGDIDGAREEFKRARAAGVNAADIDYNLSLLEMGDENFAAAEVVLERLLAADPSRASVRRELAHARLETGHATPAEVRDEMNLVLAEDPEDWRAWEILADAESQIGDPMAAKTYYTKALEFGAKELGNNPPRVEAKYVVAAQLVQDLMKAEGLEPASTGQLKRGAPPVPASVLERQREARRARAAKEAAGGQDGL